MFILYIWLKMNHQHLSYTGCNMGRAMALIYMPKVPGSILGLSRWDREKFLYESLESWCQFVLTILNYMDQMSGSDIATSSDCNWKLIWSAFCWYEWELLRRKCAWVMAFNSTRINKHIGVCITEYLNFNIPWKGRVKVIIVSWENYEVSLY